MYQDTAIRTAPVEPSAVYPAQLARYIPPPQPTVIPGQNGQPGVIVDTDGRAYYGHPPIIYAQQQPQLAVDPRASLMAGYGVCAAGVGFGASELIGAIAGASVGTLLATAAVIAVAKLKAPRADRTVNNIKEEYHQHVTTMATGLFGRATGSISNEKTFNSSQS
jgi:hypothetical protein